MGSRPNEDIICVLVDFFEDFRFFLKFYMDMLCNGSAGYCWTTSAIYSPLTYGSFSFGAAFLYISRSQVIKI